MNIFPAIDIRNQQSVRLLQGDYDQETQYGNPVEMAKRWIREGATYLHIVDLDAAKGDSSNNLKVIQTIADEVDVPIQVGGGIRSEERIKALLDIGVERVILGTAAVKEPDFVKRSVAKFGSQVVVSIDARDGYVATDGWMETSTLRALDFVKELESAGVQTIVYTDISKDGMLQGPNLSELNYMNDATSIDVIASGGVTSLDDIQALSGMGIYGAIIGKALYEGKIDLKAVMEEV
ncbi:1-(5-phosphoribosyl)-5-[(5-phosphoribosylamino)methylideneamino]imidazole-4-carboxamide isomerase [Aquisalibacillus elongatus]|uniref:1-(5-phosphoribosyl)-5-[(5-phosphoribosylamino)methylideneamino] imidazole-4-carboxamide isomerase n=1 Tax=Aquisalibacillus elongatus TaxID=485577 RepID=A0A3N5BGZ8_9BACI|nr:1-(5-phosphoribosyl)-5-[(5-phosphoribosylamino)methylideneamino]imidazole-4-carboxamide isomerase [Aquisalibacillus elongatus]RPF57064.1 1-(5-phosphoribosyl)-5-[(5-phosphoribosylamino)methylideneamino] imidazole-4-carboxamide isomerase [Aquisalibacillus elongatus]